MMLLAPCLLFSQRKAVKNVDYTRSSLHVMMIEDPAMMKKGIIINTFNEMDFPEKYDNHLLKERYANIIGDVDLSGGVLTSKLTGIEEKIDNYFKEKKIANQLVEKWFNRDASGLMDMKMISKRGLWNATEDDAAIANNLQAGYAALEHSGLELLGNTFVVLEYFAFIDNELIARPAAQAAYLTTKLAIEKGDMPEMGKKIALNAAEAVLEKALEAAQGYSVWTHAYLYQLEWNDSIQNILWSTLWLDSTSTFSNEETLKRSLEFEQTDLFSLKFVGKSKATILITNFVTERSESDQIKEATIRSIDKVYVKLQKEYDVFKTKTQFFEVDKKGKICTAKIGMKEGLEGGEKFDVLEPDFSSSGGQKWKKKGTIKVDKKSIWNNIYNVTGPPKLDSEDAIVATSFKGCKKGWGELPLLIRQQK